MAKIKIFLVSFFALLVCSGSHCHAQSGERKLQFPNYSVGSILSARSDSELFCARKISLVADARGLIKLPAGKQFEFVPNSNFYKHSDCLLKLPSDAFDFVELRFFSMADDEDELCDQAIVRLGHIKSLVALDLDKSDTSDAGLSKMGAMPNLQTITACECKVTGSCLPQLLACKKLSGFRLSNTKVDVPSLTCLKDFPQLHRLTIVRSGLTLLGLEHISKCSELNLLDIDANHKLDDKAVPLLIKLTKLKSLFIQGSGISVQGLEQLGRLQLTCLRLPKPISSYSAKEQARIRKAFPQVGFYTGVKAPVDGFTKTIFAPISR